ncbi:MAG: hypothetical protein HY267_00905 [Deltaproteobacteria bacterium]|nr:hypothetical protein [Deltaproteobacteria bacterium]
MIVLDENLLGLRLDNSIAAWYPGRVCSVTDLRSNTVIKDEAIPQLLQRLKGTTFVTTNGADFWKRVLAHARYSIVCLSLPNERLREVPELLRQLLRLPEFRTKTARMGKVIRVSRQHIQYYSADASVIQTLTWLG